MGDKKIGITETFLSINAGLKQVCVDDMMRVVVSLYETFEFLVLRYETQRSEESFQMYSYRGVKL